MAYNRMAGGGAESRRAGLGMFLESACSVSHTSSQCSIPMDGELDSHAQWQLDCRTHALSLLLRSDQVSRCEVTS
jgi:hypothetical protein